HAVGAERENKFTLRLVADDADGIRAGDRAKLNRERTQTATRAPDQNVVTGPQNMRTVAEEHAVSRGERQRVAGRLFPCEMPRPRHELAILHASELRERTVRRLITPDALR